MGRAHRPTALRRQELMGTMLHFSMAQIIIEVHHFYLIIVHLSRQFQLIDN